jgi:hypothetical protein
MVHHLSGILEACATSQARVRADGPNTFQPLPCVVPSSSSIAGGLSALVKVWPAAFVRDEMGACVHVKHMYMDMDMPRMHAGVTANCIIIGHFSAFESGLVAPFLYSA